MTDTEVSLPARHGDVAMARQMKTIAGFVLRAAAYVLILPLIAVVVLSPWAAAAWGITRLFA
jgi:hypothetical protein